MPIMDNAIRIGLVNPQNWNQIGTYTKLETKIGHQKVHKIFEF